MVRPSLLLSVCLLVAVPGLAIAKTTPPADARPYVEASYISAPRVVADFNLERSSYDPAAKLAGAGFLYRSSKEPQATASVFVYPAGRVGQAEAVESGMQALYGELKQAVAAGIYAQLQELGEEPFPLAAYVAPGKGTTAIDTAVIQTMAKAEQIHGTRLRLSMQHVSSNQPLHSNAYLFYKQLYYVKLRISADQASMSREAFDALADRAARSLIPAVQVANVGGCAAGTIYVDPSATPEQTAVQLAGQMALQKGYNCHGTASDAGVDAGAADVSVVEIRYDADDWKSQ
jgi:hypothetical protein